MLKKIIKNKKAQATIEFCLAIPVVLLLTLGAVDVAKANIIKMENTQAMQAYLSLAAADNKEGNSADIIRRFTADYIQQTSMFCTKVEGARNQPKCNSGASPVQTTIRLEKASKEAGLEAGTQICMAAKSEYKPYYSGVYGGNTMKVYSRACTLMETSKKNTAGWEQIAIGQW